MKKIFKREILLFVNVIGLFVILFSSTAIFAGSGYNPGRGDENDLKYQEHSEICNDLEHEHYWCTTGSATCQHQNCP